MANYLRKAEINFILLIITKIKKKTAEMCENFWKSEFSMELQILNSKVGLG